MAGMSEALQAEKRRKLTGWGIRQAISVCILTPIVIVWPELWWLIPIWLVLAMASLAVILVMFGRLGADAARAERKIDKLVDSDG